MRKVIFGLFLMAGSVCLAASPQDKCLQGNVCSQGSFGGVFVSSATAYVAPGGIGTAVTISTPANQSACLTDMTAALAAGQTLYVQDLTSGTTYYQMPYAGTSSNVPLVFHRDHLGPLCLPGGDKLSVGVASGTASAGLVNYEGFYADYQNK